jgi:hypothetical protein
MAYSSRAFELPGSTVVRSVRCDRPARRMSCSLARQPPRSGRASGHAFAADPRRHREARRGVELQRRWRAVCVLSRKDSWTKPRLPNLPIASGLAATLVTAVSSSYGCASERNRCDAACAGREAADRSNYDGAVRYSLRRWISQRAALQRRLPSNIWPSAVVISRGGSATVVFRSN